MTPEQLLAQVAPKMARAARGRNGIIRVCYLNHRFTCLTSDDKRAPEVVVASFFAHNIQDGLSSKAWNELSTKLQVVWRLKKL